MTSSAQTSVPHGLRRAAAAVVGFIGLWILAGALFKLFLGTPNDLPRVVQDVPLAIGTTWRLAIAVELGLAVLALLRPRWAWPLCLGALLVFDAVLLTQIARGTESCGCFGSRVTMSPWTMLAIDSVLIVALLVARPWRALAGTGGGVLLPLVLAGAAASAPWLLDREAASPGGDTDVAAEDGAEAEQGGGNGGRRWVALPVDEWVGTDLGETPLARWVDVYSMPPDALWVLYRTTCEHCAEHLARLADEEVGQRYLVLVRLEEPHDSEENRLVHRMPAGDFVFRTELPPTVEYVVTTPAEIEVEGFRVVRGEEAVGGGEG